MTTETVTITATDGTGTFSAYVSRPQSQPTAAVVVIQEIFGVNAVMRGICDDMAAKGYITICPDLFWRQEPNIDITDKTEAEWARAFQLYQGFDVDRGVDDLKATLDFIRKDAQCTGRAGTMGFCLGGKLAFLMAARSDADCNVSYYGVGLDELMGEAGNIKKPVLLHIAEQDKFVPHAAQLKIIDVMSQNPTASLHIYHGNDHAFARVGGDHYDAEAAALAHSRTDEFLAKNLG